MTDSREKENISREKEQIRVEKESFFSDVNVDFQDEIIRPSFWNQLKDVVFSW